MSREQILRQLELAHREKRCDYHNVEAVSMAPAEPPYRHAVAGRYVEACYTCGVAHVFDVRRDGSLAWDYGYLDLDELHAVELARWQQGAV